MIHLLRKIRRSDLKILAAVVAITLALVGLASACSNDADVVNKNISTDADNFKINRRIVFFNGITDKYLMTIEGFCSLDAGDPRKLTVTCKTGPNDYRRSYLGVSDNVSWFSEQLDGANVSPSHYKIVFKPSEIIPVPEIR
jgi:hypothetical protein